MKWISVLDRLPSVSGDYYLKGKGGYKTIAMFWLDEGWQFNVATAMNKVDEEYLFWLDEFDETNDNE